MVKRARGVSDRLGQAIKKRKGQQDRSRAMKAMSMYRANDRMVHAFQRWATIESSSVIVLATAEQGLGKEFRLNDLQSYTDFTNLYDQYMITGVLCEIQLLSNPDAQGKIAGTAATAANFYPRVWYCSDPDDAGTPTLAEMKQRQRVKHSVLKPNSIIKFFIKPAVLAQTYSSAITTGYAPKWAQWVDISNPGVPHYGLKALFDTSGVSLPVDQQFVVRVDYKYYLKCRLPR